MTHREEHPELYPIPLPLDTKEFTANGTRYFVSSNTLLSMNRLKYVKEFVDALAYRRNPLRLISEMEQLTSLLDPDDTEELKSRLKRIIVSLESFDTLQYPPDYYVCALFINRADEDVTEFSIADAEAKIKDWGPFEAYAFHQWAMQFLARLNN